MANVENVVKIMKFHSLMRVDKAKKQAEKYFAVESELRQTIIEIMHNKNLNLDKRIFQSNKKGVNLAIYFGNDLGFCGNFNTSIVRVAHGDIKYRKIVIGNKIKHEYGDVLLQLSKEDFYNRFNSIEEIIYPLIEKDNLNEISVVYNHYYSINEIKLEKVIIFPVELDSQKNSRLDIDYVIEADVNKIFTQFLMQYLWFQLKIVECNSWASENIMRERITSESLKRIEEINNIKSMNIRKEKKQRDFKKIISNYRKLGG